MVQEVQRNKQLREFCDSAINRQCVNTEEPAIRVNVSRPGSEGARDAAMRASGRYRWLRGAPRRTPSLPCCWLRTCTCPRAPRARLRRPTCSRTRPASRRRPAGLAEAPRPSASAGTGARLPPGSRTALGSARPRLALRKWTGLCVEELQETRSLSWRKQMVVRRAERETQRRGESAPLPFTRSSAECDVCATPLLATHVYVPACAGRSASMLRALMWTPNARTPASAGGAPSSLRHSMLSGGSPLLITHCTLVRSPACRSVWNEKGAIFGGTATYSLYSVSVEGKVIHDSRPFRSLGWNCPE